MKKLLIGFVAFLTVMLLLTGTFFAGLVTGIRVDAAKRASMNDTASMDRVSEAMGLIMDNYVENVSADKLAEGAVKGMVESLNDPYTHYMNKKDFGSFKEDTTGKFEGVGMIVGAKDGRVAVMSLIEATPAERAGIKSGDLILQIDDKETKGMSVDDAVAKIRGKKGTKVELALGREGTQEPVKVSLIREEINMPNVTSKILDGRNGYIRIHTFNEQTDKDLKSSIEKVKKGEVKGIILDLRNNPGGLLGESVMVASKFLDAGPVVKVKGRDGRVIAHPVRPGDDTDAKIPLVVLVNGGSASASEIVSGAIQDYHRGVIVGEKTFGKASVQTVLDLSDGNGLLLTTDTYLTPNGRLIHKKGIVPDVEIKLDEKAMVESGKDVQLDKAKEVLEELISGKRKP